VSVGSGPARATFALIWRIAEELLAEGTYHAFCRDQLSQSEVAAMLVANPSARARPDVPDPRSAQVP
jgi:hypothetical protein